MEMTKSKKIKNKKLHYKYKIEHEKWIWEFIGCA